MGAKKTTPHERWLETLSKGIEIPGRFPIFLDGPPKRLAANGEVVKQPNQNRSPAHNYNDPGSPLE